MIALGWAVFGSIGTARGAGEDGSSRVRLSQPVVGEPGRTLIREDTNGSEGVDALRNRIDRDLEALDRYEKRLAHASREDSLVLRRQIAHRQVSALRALHRLAGMLMEMEKEGEQPKLRRDVETRFATVTPLLQPYVDALREEIDELRARRWETPVGRRLDLENHIAKQTGFLDEVYRIYLDHLAKEELLGLGDSTEVARLKRSLMDRADELSGRLDYALERANELKNQYKTDSSNQDLPILISAVKITVETNVSSLQASVDLMDKLDLPTSTYRAQLVAATRDISSGIFDVNVVSSLLGQAMDSLGAWFRRNGPRLLIKVLLFALILFAFRTLAKLVRRALDHALGSAKVKTTQLLRRMIVNTTYNLIMFMGLLIGLAQFGISIGPLMAGLGVAGFIIGFALQDTLANFASGMMILFYRPYDVGDVVEIGGVFGKVDKMSLVSTNILTLDHQTMVVPNNKIWGDVIKNVTDQRIRRVDLVFGISYSDDVEKAERVLMEILQDSEKILDNPAPVVRLHELADSSVNFVVRPWAKTEDYWEVYWDVTRKVKMRFDEEGISIPFPQRDVHLRKD